MYFLQVIFDAVNKVNSHSDSYYKRHICITHIFQRQRKMSWLRYVQMASLVQAEMSAVHRSLKLKPGNFRWSNIASSRLIICSANFPTVSINICRGFLKLILMSSSKFSREDCTALFSGNTSVRSTRNACMTVLKVSAEDIAIVICITVYAKLFSLIPWLDDICPFNDEHKSVVCM